MNGLIGIPFTKMNGLGNDFVIIDARTREIELSPQTVLHIADRDRGIGCDQLIRLDTGNDATTFMRIWNADGNEVDVCGNATRCIAWILMEEIGEDQVSISSNAGTFNCTRAKAPMSISVDMGCPRVNWQDIPLSEPFSDTRTIELHVEFTDVPLLHSPSVINVGNPHCIFWVDDITAHDLGKIGRSLEHHPLFPDRANISLAQVITAKTLALRVWERGTGLTKACGTAACAATVAAHRKCLTDREVDVMLPGGVLSIDWRSDDHIIMTGPITFEYSGIIPNELIEVTTTNTQQTAQHG